MREKWNIVNDPRMGMNHQGKRKLGFYIILMIMEVYQAV